MPAVPGVLATLIAVWAVHKLTRSREREKAVYDLYKIADEVVVPLKEAAILAWSLPKGPERRRAVAETKWRLQQLGGTAERLRKMSRRRTWWLREVSIALTTEMKELRETLTGDPFEDPGRRADKSKSEQVEQAIGAFISTLDDKVFLWMR